MRAKNVLGQDCKCISKYFAHKNPLHGENILDGNKSPWKMEAFLQILTWLFLQ